jgi:hypothetical protein
VSAPSKGSGITLCSLLLQARAINEYIGHIQGLLSDLSRPLDRIDRLHVRYADADAETGVVIHFFLSREWFILSLVQHCYAM